MAPITPEQQMITELRRARRVRTVVIITGLALIALLQIFYCNKGKNASEAYAKIDSALNAVLADNERILAVGRAYKADLAEKDLRYAELLDEKKILQKEVIDKSAQANRLIGELKLAKIRRDTATLLSKCDSLADITGSLMRKVDSLMELDSEKDVLYAHKEDIYRRQVAHFEKAYNDCVASVKVAKEELPNIAPSAKLKLDVSAITGAITGIGGGLTYEDKKDRSYTINGLITNHGMGVMAKYSVPIFSFKRKAK